MTEQFGKRRTIVRQVWIREINANESLMMCRECDTRVVKTIGNLRSIGLSIAETCLLAMRQPAYRRDEPYLGLYMEHGNLVDDDQRPHIEQAAH